MKKGTGPFRRRRYTVEQAARLVELPVPAGPRLQALVVEMVESAVTRFGEAHVRRHAATFRRGWQCFVMHASRGGVIVR